MLLKLSVDFLHRLQADTDDNQKGRAAEGHLSLRNMQRDDRQRRDQCDSDQVESTGGGDSVDHVAQIFSRRTAGTIAGNKAAVALHVVRYFIGIESDRGVEEGEEEREQGVGGQVGPRVLMEVGADPLDPLGVLAAKLSKHRGECKKR